MNVKELREKNKLSQKQLADLTGIPKGRINGWEQTGSQPKAKDHKILEEFFSNFENKISRKSLTEDADNMNNETALSLAAKAIEALKTQLAVADADKKVIWSEYRDTVSRLEKDKDRMTDDKSELYSIIKGLTLAIGNAPAKQS